MPETNLLNLARQGNLKAISKLLNDGLSLQEVTVKIRKKNRTLQILLKSQEIADKKYLTEFIHRGILKLHLQEIEKLQIFNLILNEEIPSWSETIELASKKIQSKESLQKNENTNSQSKQDTVDKLVGIEFSKLDCHFKSMTCPLKQIMDQDIDDSGETVISCQECKYHYLVTSGKLEARYSRQNTIQRKSKKQAGIYNREYELRLLMPNLELNEIHFKVEGKEDYIKVRKGDIISISQTLKDRNKQSIFDTVFIYDHTTRKTYQSGKPDGNAYTMASSVSSMHGCFMTVVGFILYFLVLLVISFVFQEMNSFFIFLFALGWLIFPIFFGIREGKKAYEKTFQDNSIQFKTK